MKQFWSKTSTLIITAIFCCTLWGSAYPCIKVGYRLFSIVSGNVPGQLFFAGCRFALAGILVILAGSLLQKELLLPEKSDWKPIAVLALFQTILQYIFFYMGLARASAVRSSIINGTGAFVAILLAVYMFRLEKMTLKKFIGCFLGFSGVLLVETVGQTVNFGFAWNGEGFILLSVFASSTASILIKIFLPGPQPGTAFRLAVFHRRTDHGHRGLPLRRPNDGGNPNILATAPVHGLHLLRCLHPVGCSAEIPPGEPCDGVQLRHTGGRRAALFCHPVGTRRAERLRPHRFGIGVRRNPGGFSGIIHCAKYCP